MQNAEGRMQNYGRRSMIASTAMQCTTDYYHVIARRAMPDVAISW